MAATKILYAHLLTTGRLSNIHGIYKMCFLYEEDGAPVDKFESLVQPLKNRKCNVHRLESKGLTEKEVMGYPDPKGVCDKLFDFMNRFVDINDRSDKFHLAGYNIARPQLNFLSDFCYFVTGDSNKLFKYIWTTPIDIAVLAAHELREQRPQMKGFGLGYVADKYGVFYNRSEVNDTSGQIETIRGIYKKIINRY